MPEGPSIAILREQTARFTGRTIRAASGYAKDIDYARLPGLAIVGVHSWGKHFLIELPDFLLRIHLLMFGSYRIDERKDTLPRLRLEFQGGGELNFYTCSVRQLAGHPGDWYDWRGDVMADAWSPRLALKKLRAAPQLLACDALMNQDIFAGVGNIIKNEVLFRIRVHPLSEVGALPQEKLRALVREARQYSFEFKAWKEAFVLKQHWLVHTRKTCPRCDIPLMKGYLGTTGRRSFYCENCQKRYKN
jgi:endonuclease VIII